METRIDVIDWNDWIELAWMDLGLIGLD